MEQDRQEAEASRLVAEEDMRRTEENMRATIAASWKQGSDGSGRNYYYNYVTGESSWVPPEDWIIKPSEQWVRNEDERGNIFYFNIKTGESRWLAPCITCGKQSQKWCLDCSAAYCDVHFQSYHIDTDDEASLSKHSWSLTEDERDRLEPGEAYCVECCKKKAVDMCTTCWDPYCSDCFNFTHKSGNLRKHATMEYKTAKKGWICVKARSDKEKDYYINGTTSQTTYEKPVSLMTEQERVYYDNFQLHKEAAEKYVGEVAALQVALETASFERDKVVYDSLTKTNKKGETESGILSLMGEKPLAGTFHGKGKTEYRKFLLQPSSRRRGKERSDYIKGLLDSVIENNSATKEQD